MCESHTSKSIEWRGRKNIRHYICEEEEVKSLGEIEIEIEIAMSEEGPKLFTNKPKKKGNWFKSLITISLHESFIWFELLISPFDWFRYHRPAEARQSQRNHRSTIESRCSGGGGFVYDGRCSSSTSASEGIIRSKVQIHVAASPHRQSRRRR